VKFYFCFLFLADTHETQEGGRCCIWFGTPRNTDKGKQSLISFPDVCLARDGVWLFVANGAPIV
jgi:hypothetical protein